MIEALTAGEPDAAVLAGMVLCKKPQDPGPGPRLGLPFRRSSRCGGPGHPGSHRSDRGRDRRRHGRLPHPWPFGRLGRSGASEITSRQASTRHGGTWLRLALIEGANSVSRSKGTYLGT
jgi:hypothetical protein